MAEPLKHVPVAYPTLDEGMHSAEHLLNVFLGSSETLNQIVAHAWVASGAGLGVVFPTFDTKVYALAEVATPEEKEALKLALAPRGDVGAVDWKSILKIMLPILLRLLNAL